MSTHVEGPLRVSSSTPPQAAAASIVNAIFDGSNKLPKIRAIGHSAVGQTVKALAIARGQVAAKGMDLVFSVGFETITNDNGDEISAMAFQCINRD